MKIKLTKAQKEALFAVHNKQVFWWEKRKKGFPLGARKDVLVNLVNKNLIILPVCAKGEMNLFQLTEEGKKYVEKKAEWLKLPLK